MEVGNIKEIQNQIPKKIQIVAATKYVTSIDMKKLFQFGIYHFGENRVDSFLEKYDDLKEEKICWHFIGHLQRNKALKIIDKIQYLHSLDSIELAKIINENRKNPLKCFLEININNEETKHGIKFEKLDYYIKEILKLKNIELIGFMMMSKKVSSLEEKQKQFKALAYLLQRTNERFHLSMKELSMGMSDDYMEAIKAGATYIRLGRILWKQEK
ncbi:MAG: YggS family pyridoxal phosphate-dependent enzyme [Anaeroplasmataceae bacterium]|nr:YggS family pyridoxal phosphate-dependent enzyme [Anaeroplasmataceae bacterium]